MTAVNGRAMYARGKQFEYKTRDHLADNGYWVMLSPGSKSPVDIVAIKPRQVLFVQCKIGGTLLPTAWNELFDAAAAAGATPVMAERPGRGRIAYWELTARKTAPRARQPMTPFTIDQAGPQ